MRLQCASASGRREAPKASLFPHSPPRGCAASLPGVAPLQRRRRRHAPPTAWTAPQAVPEGRNLSPPCRSGWLPPRVAVFPPPAKGVTSMSLVENLKTRAAAKGAPSPAGNPKRSPACRNLPWPILRHSTAPPRLMPLSKMPGADATLRDLEQKLTAQRQRVQTWTAAHKGGHGTRRGGDPGPACIASEDPARCLPEALAGKGRCCGWIEQSDCRSCRALPRARLDRSAKAQAACPVLTSWPDGGLCGLADLRRLVTGEMYRASASNSRDDRALPGAHHPSAETEWNPKGIAPLADQVKAASAFLASRLKGGAE